jgi:putative oxidoreductase
MQAETQTILLALGRLLLGGLFVVGGIRHLFDLPAITQAIAARAIPAAELVLLSGTGFQIVAGLALIFDFYPTWTALGLVAFTVAASVLLLIGGLLVTAAHSL